MASQTRSAGLGQSIALGNRIWSYPERIYVSDDSRAYSRLYPDDISYWLRATTFGFSIPDGATIDGIVAEFEKRASGYGIEDYSVKIVKAGAEGGDEKKKTAVEWLLTDSYISYGGAADKWGLTWTPAEINAVGFGVSIAADYFEFEGDAQAQIDHVRITVYYTEVALTNMKINIGDVFKDADEIKINIGDVWKPGVKAWQNVGDVWKVIFG